MLSCPLIIVNITIQCLQHKSCVLYCDFPLQRIVACVYKVTGPYTLVHRCHTLTVAAYSLSLPRSLYIVHGYCGHQLIQLLLLVCTQ